MGNIRLVVSIISQGSSERVWFSGGTLNMPTWPKLLLEEEFQTGFLQRTDIIILNVVDQVSVYFYCRSGFEHFS